MDTNKLCISTDTVSSHTKPAAKKRSNASRVVQQSAFVLHSHVYSESSLLLDVFTHDYGRVGILAKGAKRPTSRLRGVLQTFQLLSLDYSGRSQLRTLIGAEWVGGMLPLRDSALLYGFYLNELIIRLLAREDPHPELFDAYMTALVRLANTHLAESVLRMFELTLLKQIGVCPDLTIDSDLQTPVLPNEIYIVDPEAGPRKARSDDTGPKIFGKTLTNMVSENYDDPLTQQQSKLVMRSLLAHHLNGIPLQTRKILVDLMQM